MNKLEAIHGALLGLVEDLEGEEAKFNSATNRIIAIANFLTQNGVSSEPQAIDWYHIKPRIRFEILKDSFMVEGELVATHVSGREELVLQAIPRLTFLLNGPRDLVVMERLKTLFIEFQELGAGKHHKPEGFKSLGEFKFFLSFFTTT